MGKHKIMSPLHNSLLHKRNRLSTALFAALLLPLTGAAFAQDSAEEAPATPASCSSQGTTNLDKVTVVGSRIKRSPLGGPSHVAGATVLLDDHEVAHTV